MKKRIVWAGSILAISFLALASWTLGCGDDDDGESTPPIGGVGAIKEDFASLRYILFAHGMSDNLHGWDMFAAATEVRGFNVLRTNVDGCGSIETRATQLAEYITGEVNVPPGVRFKAVSHSMGGLDLRKIVGEGHKGHVDGKKYYEAAQKISKVYTMATPHTGQFFADKLNVGACDKDSPARQDLSDDSIAQFNTDYPYSDFSIDGVQMAFLAYQFECWGCGGYTDCVVSTSGQTWGGAPTSGNTLSGKHSNDLMNGVGVGCTNERDNLEEVLFPIINDAIGYGYVAPAEGGRGHGSAPVQQAVRKVRVNHRL